MSLCVRLDNFVIFSGIHTNKKLHQHSVQVCSYNRFGAVSIYRRKTLS